MRWTPPPFRACSRPWSAAASSLRVAGSPRKRCGIVELTEKGRQAALDWLDGGAEFDEKLLRGFSDEEREQFASFIRRAYRNLRSGEEITDG